MQRLRKLDQRSNQTELRNYIAPRPMSYYHNTLDTNENSQKNVLNKMFKYTLFILKFKSISILHHVLVTSVKSALTEKERPFADQKIHS